LVRIVADPAVSIKDVTEGSVSTDASPMRLDFVAAVNKALPPITPREWTLLPMTNSPRRSGV